MSQSRVSETFHWSLSHKLKIDQVALTSSGVAKLGHAGPRALATRGCAPPVQALLKIIGAELGAKSAQRC